MFLKIIKISFREFFYSYFVEIVLKTVGRVQLSPWKAERPERADWHFLVGKRGDTRCYAPRLMRHSIFKSRLFR